jgi:hypothetical protein
MPGIPSIEQHFFWPNKSKPLDIDLFLVKTFPNWAERSLVHLLPLPVRHRPQNGVKNIVETLADILGQES